MFSSETVLIVGAGASVEAGLPTGDQLKTKIASLLNINESAYERPTGDQRILRALRELTRDASGISSQPGPLIQKCRRISEVMPVASISIDNFLDAHREDPDLVLCGKLGIAKAILDAEANSKMRYLEDHHTTFDIRPLKDTWYMKFFHLLTEGVSRGDFRKIFDRVSIVTFNYDRCIEHFLVQAISNYYSVSLEEAQQAVAQLRIYHAYGSVGPLPWQKPGIGIRFGNNEKSDIVQISRGIRTFTEGLSDETIRSSIKKAMAEAQTAIFLGFAFHPQNMELMRPREARATRVFATTHGFSGEDQLSIDHDIAALFGRKPSSSVPEIAIFEGLRIVSRPMHCVKLFETCWRSLHSNSAVTAHADS